MSEPFRSFLFAAAMSLVFSSAHAGTVVEYHPGGKIHLETNVDARDLPHGLAREYSEDGTLIGERNFVHGSREGSSKLYYPTGELMTEWVYKNGERNGPTLGYYKSGKLKDRGFYKNDKLEGAVRMYNLDGSLKAEMNFKDDRQDGAAKTYEGDKLQYLYTYKKGRLVNRKTYDQAGKLIASEDYSFPKALP